MIVFYFIKGDGGVAVGIKNGDTSLPQTKKPFPKTVYASLPSPMCGGLAPFHSSPSTAAQLTLAPPRLAQQTTTHATTTYREIRLILILHPPALKFVIRTNKCSALW